jgi:hypothetical protein
MLARSENRGLGIQTHEFFRHVKPDRTLLVDMGELARGFDLFPERFPGATVAEFRDGMFDEPLVREWLDGLDVVFTAETFYDWRMVDWARSMGVATVVQLNPEFYRHAVDNLPEPSVWWAPSPWRMEHLHKDTRLVGVPVAADRFPMELPEPAERIRFVHVAGHQAAGDRNGTRQLFQALRVIRHRMTVRIITQDPKLPAFRPHRGIDIETETRGRPDYWDLYRDADVLLMPRRYGGLCLPVQEAMACGLGVVMSQVSPNDWWPTVRVAGSFRGVLNTGTGPVRMYATNPRKLGEAMVRLSRNRDELRAAQEASLGWAREHTWEKMLPQYRTELERAADHA